MGSEEMLIIGLNLTFVIGVIGILYKNVQLELFVIYQGEPIQLPILKTEIVFFIFDIYTLQVCQFMFKFMSNALPTNFSDYFEFNFNIHLYNTRPCSDLHINTVKTVKRSKSLRHNGPRIWNCLSHEIKLEKKTFSTFTRKLKLLQLYV